MKILIAGGGKVGSAVARRLAGEDNDITLIDHSERVVGTFAEQIDVMTVLGNCTVKDTLETAGAADADLLIAVTGSDETNLLCCMTAHYINPKMHTIARIRNPEYTKQIYEMRDVFALSMIINPEKQAADEIRRLLQFPGSLKLDTFAKGRVEIVELRVDVGSKLCDIPLTSIQHIAGCKVLVCAVLRDGVVVMPSGDFVIKEGDRIFVTASTQNLTLLLRNLGAITRKIKRVLICGGGRTSYYLAANLSASGVNTRIIERDLERCRALSELLPNVDIINADATNRDLLESEGLLNCDSLITVTGMDEVNIIISLFGNSVGVPQVITKLGHIDDSRIIGNIQLGSVISPKELCCSSIVRYVRAMGNQTGAATAVHFIADGKAEAIEFVVDDTSKGVGVPLKQLKLKQNVLLACISKGARTVIPDGNASFDVGDTIVVVTNNSSRILCLGDIFA